MSSKNPNGPDRGQPPNGGPSGPNGTAGQPPGQPTPGQRGSSGYAFGSLPPAKGQTPKPRGPGPKSPKGPVSRQGAKGPAGSGARRGGATRSGKARRSRKSKKRLTIIGAVAAVVVLAGGAGAVLATSGSNTVDPGVDPSGSSKPGQPSVPPAGATASDAVSGYLEALASGDADAALAYSAQPLDSGGTLSDAVLAASGKKGKITEINVPAITDENATAVDATYKVGSTPVTETFPVAKAADGWKLQQVVAVVSLGTILDAKVPLKINGAAVTSETVSLFPGSYKVTSGLKTVTYGSKNTLVVQRPSEAPVSRLKLTATTAGKKIARTEARNAYRACLKQKAAAPKGCPFGLATSSDSKISKSTIAWKQSGPDPFKKAAFLLIGRSIGVRVMLDVTLTADCTKSGLPATCTGTVKAKRIGYVLTTNTDKDVIWGEP